jgi:membrane protease YdiL (CAAX protease family)
MSTNLAVEAVAEEPPARFPYSNWGPWIAVLGVILAIGAGAVLAIPAFVLGEQSGGIERFSPPSYASGAAFDSTDSLDVAVDETGGTIYSAQEDAIAAFTPAGRSVGAPFGDFDSVDGLGVAGRSGDVYVSEGSTGRILRYRGTAGSLKQEGAFDGAGLPDGQAEDFEPERIAVDRSRGEIYVVDRGNDAVVRFSASGAYRGQIEGSDAPAGSFDFDASGAESDVAVDDSSGRDGGNLYVVSRGEGNSGAVWAFDRGGAFLWEMPAPDGHSVCGAAVDSGGHLWIAYSGGEAAQYAGGRGASQLPAPTGKTAPTSSEACGLAFDASNRLYAARAPQNLTTAASIVVQLATALGFLLVPLAIAAMAGATSVGAGLRRLGVRTFGASALKWMAAAVGAYYLFAVFYVVLIGQPEQKDIAEAFGPIPVQVLLIVFVASISEELCFRGFLFSGLREKLPRVAAALLSGLIFGGLHAATGISAVPPLIAFGFVLALLYEKTGSIVPGILLHMLNNSVALLGQ